AFNAYTRLFLLRLRGRNQSDLSPWLAPRLPVNKAGMKGAQRGISMLAEGRYVMSAFRSRRSLAVSVLSLALVLALPAFGQFRYGGRVDRDDFSRVVDQAQSHSQRFMEELGDEHEWLRERVGELQGRLANIENDVNREANFFEIRSDISSAMNV